VRQYYCKPWLFLKSCRPTVWASIRRPCSPKRTSVSCPFWVEAQVYWISSQVWGFSQQLRSRQVMKNIRVLEFYLCFWLCAVDGGVVEALGGEVDDPSDGHHVQAEHLIDDWRACFGQISLNFQQFRPSIISIFTWLEMRQVLPKAQGHIMRWMYFPHFGFCGPYGSSHFGLKTPTISPSIFFTK